MRQSWILIVLCSLALGCGSDAPDSSAVESDVSESPASDGVEPVDAVTLNTPVADPTVAARAFQLYYRERVERAVVAHQRYGVFGDVSFGTAIDRAYVAIDGDEVEIIGGPKDNNLIGTATWTTWEAYRLYGGRLLELATLRLLNGLVFFEEVSGHPGMTAREVLPGWTRVVDGREGARSVTRTRDGEVVTDPWERDAALEAEMIATFWDGRRYTYREDPSEFVYSWTAVGELDDYATTHSFDMLPDYVPVTNCCSSFKRVPDDRPWGGAFWGNHNSRDNLPDLLVGYLAAMDVAAFEGSPEVLKQAAQRAAEAGQRIADTAMAHGNALMTVDEWNDYDTLVVSGTIRPHGEAEVENGDLGSMSSCPMAYLTQAMTTSGLDVPVGEVPLGVNAEAALMGSDEVAEFGLECAIDEGPPACDTLGDAYCGLTWSTVDELTVLGTPWLDLVAMWDENEPGKAAELLGSFQNDYDDVVESMVTLARYAKITGRSALEAEVMSVLADMTDLMRRFADLVWSSSQPAEQVKQRYEAAIFDALVGREVVVEDLEDFARAEARIAAFESALTLGDTAPWPLMSDEEIYESVEANLAGEKLDMVVQRYRDTYGETPPIRRAGDGYEARGYPLEKRPWTPVETPRHTHVGGVELLQTLPLCRTAPHLLDCTWAVLGCAHVDRNADGTVDEDDRPDFAVEPSEGCQDDNAWCGGADLDRSGTVDSVDEAFFQTAQGCWYDTI